MRHVALKGDVRNSYRIRTAVGKSERKRQLQRLRHKWEDNIKICRKGKVYGLKAVVKILMNLCFHERLNNF